MKYILAFIENYGGTSVHEWYGGGSYIFQGEKYAVITSINKAKRFQSRKNAENAHKKLSASCVNVNNEFDILEVEE